MQLETHIETVKAFLWNAVWAVNLGALPPARRGVVRTLRILHMMLRELADGQLNVWAASLVYTTLLSIVPVLAVSFAVLKGFGVHNQLEPTLLGALEPLGEKGPEIAHRIVVFVENVEVGRLGWMGLAVLIFTVISVMQKVERALNYTWRVSERRRFFERFSGYLSVILVGPVLIFTAMGITASVMGSEIVREMLDIAPLGALVALASRLVPYLLVVAAFMFVYYYLPNTKVRARSALVGALLSGFLWALAGWLFAALVVTSTRYTAIYSSFAILILFMMWLYVGWLILLVGGSVAFYHQHPEYQGLLTHELKMSARMRERVALAACFLVAQHFHHRCPPWSAAALARRLGVPLGPLENLLAALERRGVLLRVRGEPAAYVPARELDAIAVKDVLDATRAAEESRQLELEQVRAEPVVEEIGEDVERAVEEALAGRTLRDLAAAYAPRAGQEAAAAEPPSPPVPISAAKREGGGRS